MEISPPMRAVLRIAMAEAKLCHNRWLEPEHLFLAVCKLIDFSEIISSIPGAREDVLWINKLLIDANLSCVAVRRRIRSSLRKNGVVKGVFSQHRSDRCKDVFDAAQELAWERGASAIGIRQFVSVLMVEESPLLRQVVTDLDGSWIRLRRAVGLRDSNGTIGSESSETVGANSLGELGLDLPPNIEGYRIVSPIDKGGMGMVWCAQEIDTGRRVALKVIASRYFTSERARQRFRREVRVAMGLRHKNIAEVYDNGVHQDDYYYTMKLIDGLPLNKYAAQARPSLKQFAQLIAQLCRTIHFAHQADVVHRDLKPSNILISEDGEHHVLDFGLAKILREQNLDETLSIEGQGLGTPAYMSPEQAEGCHDKTDVRADVYSLGVILYELLTCELPFKGRRDEIVHQVLHNAPRPPTLINPEIDLALEVICLKAMEKDADHRYPSTGVMADALDQYLQGDAVEG